jgi:uncharacterized protein (DUF2235 family)
MITKKDWLIIDTALAFYESNMEGSDDEECTRLNFLAKSHKEQFGDINKTMNDTRRRVHQMIQKKGIKL